MSDANQDDMTDGEASSSSCSEASDRRVSFSTIEIREHAMIMGISPSTSKGCPLEIDWEELGRYSLDLDQYEEMRPPRRVKDQLAMPSALRETVLLESGYTKRQIHERIRLVQLDRQRSLWDQKMSNLVGLPRRIMTRTRAPAKPNRSKCLV